MIVDQKREFFEREERWDYLASVKDFKCARCGFPIPYGEREVFFESRFCGYCAHVTNKDD